MNERKLIEKLYDDEMTVCRAVHTDVDGLAEEKWESIGEAIPCGLSFGGEGKSAQSSHAHTIDYNVTIFAAPELDIQPGDMLSVTCCGRIYYYEVIGFPQLYPSHQEIRGKGRGLA